MPRALLDLWRDRRHSPNGHHKPPYDEHPAGRGKRPCPHAHASLLALLQGVCGGGSHQRLTNRSRIIVGGPPQSRAAVKPLVSMATLTVVFPAAMVSRRSSVSHRCLPSPGRCLLSSSRVSGAVSDTGKEQIDYVRICDLVALGRKSRKERRREKEKRNALLANNLKPRSFEGPCFWLRSQVTEFA